MIKKALKKILILLCCVCISQTCMTGIIYANELAGAGVDGLAPSLDGASEDSSKTVNISLLNTTSNLAKKAKELSSGETMSIVEKIKKQSAETDPPVIRALVKRLEEKKNSVYNNIAIAKIDGNFVNIRDKAGTDGKVLGKIYNNAAAKILKKVPGADGSSWYRIKSGTVTGYIKSEFFVTGDAAEKLATKVGYVNAKVNTSSLRLRKSPDLGSPTLTVLAKDEVYTVEERGTEFSKLSVDGEIEGYVHNDYIKIFVEYQEAISIEEEQAKLAEQARLRAEAEKAARLLAEEESREKAKKETKSTKSSSKKSTKESTKSKKSSKSKKRSAIVAEAKKYYGNLKYVLGGDSLETGTDCSGFVQQIYMMFGIDLPRVSDEQGQCGTKVSSSEMRPGDLVYYGGHIAIYIGDGEVIHCSSPKANPNTRISSWNYRSVISIRNVIGD